MTLKPCIVCGDVAEGSRCPEHRLPANHHRPGKASARQRGYDAAWTQLSRRARRLQPFCSDCGATADLQCDHSTEAWARHDQGLAIRVQDIDVVCGPCNRARGKARSIRRSA